ncbi:MAG: radical SAM protein [Thermoguttaceae bacterium]
MEAERFSYAYRQFVLEALCAVLQGRARLANRRFFCRSLAGAARDGIFINSDMTVSCNCQDIDGTGQLGSLREHRFEDIFAGPTATAFRRMLAAGRLPTSRCAACFHLRTVSPEVARQQIRQFRLPDGLSVENTVCCNLRCLSCCRQQVLKTRRGQRFLSLEDVKTVARTLRRLRARYCGYYNLGEPFFSPTIGRELEILRAFNPELEILISTNGLLLDSDEKRKAALLADEILFSIDGISTRMVRQYQRGGDFDRAYRNLAELVRFRDRHGRRTPRIHWKYVVFRWNDKPAWIRRAIELARNAGADCIQFVFARTPVYGISWRFLVFGFFRRLGVSDSWRWRYVWLRGDRSGGSGRFPSRIDPSGILAVEQMEPGCGPRETAQAKVA